MDMGEAKGRVQVPLSFRRPPRNVWVTVVVTVLANLLLLRVHLFLGLGIVFASARTDASGRGGPFRSCTAESLSCTGPHYVVIVACALLMLALYYAAARFSFHIGRCRPGHHMMPRLIALSAVVSLGGSIAYFTIPALL